jgi:hypothetical protein
MDVAAISKFRAGHLKYDIDDSLLFNECNLKGCIPLCSAFFIMRYFSLIHPTFSFIQIFIFGFYEFRISHTTGFIPISYFLHLKCPVELGVKALSPPPSSSVLKTPDPAP